MNIAEMVKLAELLGELGHIKRATRLPNGEPEPDSHHSFMLALVAYDICQKHCPELDSNKVVLYALAHDLLEVITGDEDTLHYDAAAFLAKQQREQEALKEFEKLFDAYPSLQNAMYEYEHLDTKEAATVFVLDKACTTWTFLYAEDGVAFARKERQLVDQQSIEDWAGRQRQKIARRLKVQPPPVIMEIYEESFLSLRGLYDKRITVDADHKEA